MLNVFTEEQINEICSPSFLKRNKREIKEQFETMGFVLMDQEIGELVSIDDAFSLACKYFQKKYSGININNEYQLKHFKALIYCYVRFSQFEEDKESLSLIHYDNWARLEDMRGRSLSFEEYYQIHHSNKKKSFEKANEGISSEYDKSRLLLSLFPQPLKQMVFDCYKQQNPIRIGSLNVLKKDKNWNQIKCMVKEKELQDFIIIKEDSMMIYPDIECLLTIDNQKEKTTQKIKEVTK